MESAIGSSSHQPPDVAGLAEHLTACSIAVRASGAAGTRLLGVTQDSRRVRPGDLFVAVPGTRTDGARYVEQAAHAGAAAVVCGVGADPAGLPALWVGDPARAAGPAAAYVLGCPAEAIDLVAVTGTNGKTSVSYLLESMFAAAGRRPGVLGTIAERCAAFHRPARLTTPAASDIQTTLAEMRDAGVDCAVLEVSSHALVQHRVGGCRFAAGIFTNLTRDHLDYHAGEQEYFEAKATLFREYLDPVAGIAVLNRDDARVDALAGGLHDVDVWSYSTRSDSQARVIAVPLEEGIDGMVVEIRSGGRHARARCALIGAVNVSNIAAACAAALALGLDLETAAAGVAACRPVPGRLERIGQGQPAVLVDYAHTPDALARAVGALADYAGGRLLVVFGCGGDRDRGKRPLMAAAVAERADVAVATSDNPRSEDPEAILDDVEVGLAGRMPRLALEDLCDPRARGYLREADRARAIRVAVEAAGAGDVILVAGKGHEDYQEVDGVRHPFDDRALVAELLAGL